MSLSAFVGLSELWNVKSLFFPVFSPGLPHSETIFSILSSLQVKKVTVTQYLAKKTTKPTWW